MHGAWPSLHCVPHLVVQLIEHDISSYVAAVQDALPLNSKLPGYEYGASGCFGYFELKLKVRPAAKWLPY